MRRRVLRGFKKGLEDIGNDLLEGVHCARVFVHVIKARDLDEPADVGRVQFVVDHPSGESIPLIQAAAVDTDPPFDHLILAAFQIRDDFFCDLGKVSAVYEVVRLQENGPQSALAHWVVL